MIDTNLIRRIANKKSKRKSETMLIQGTPSVVLQRLDAWFDIGWKLDGDRYFHNGKLYQVLKRYA